MFNRTFVNPRGLLTGRISDWMIRSKCKDAGSEGERAGGLADCLVGCSSPCHGLSLLLLSSLFNGAVSLPSVRSSPLTQRRRLGEAQRADIVMGLLTCTGSQGATFLWTSMLFKGSKLLSSGGSFLMILFFNINLLSKSYLPPPSLCFFFSR